MGGGASGKGTSQAKTEQQVTNKQVASQSGIALGADARDNVINVQSADPGVAKTAIETAIGGNAVVTDMAFNFAGRAGEAAAKTADNATQTAIAGNTFLASKFVDALGEDARQNIGLLQSVGQNATDIAMAGQRSADKALEQSFNVSKSVAPQDPSYALQTTLSKTAYIIVAVIVAGIAAIFIFRKKA
jgi:hypothetical protein